MKTDSVITELETRVARDLTPIDCQQVYRDMLDELYPVVNIGSLSFNPSRVVEELDPIAFRCGVSDYFATGEYVEIGGETYRQDDAEEIKAAMVAELEEIAAGLEMDIDANLEPEVGTKGTLQEQLDTIRAQLATLESHSF